ncbi:MAG TPA: C1 family peptidase [Bauldia sp.]|nr:C1 family peptidase [Bauldia sp.]
MAGEDGFRLATVKRDRPDLRDLTYFPSLRALPRRLDPPAPLIAALSDRRRARRIVRNQLLSGEEGRSSCTAQALASVIDILRFGDGASDGRALAEFRASAEMLYTEGRLIEAAELGRSQPAEGLNSLRSAIKAYYHNGVCTEDDWRRGKEARDEGGHAVVVAKAARNITLGAYYRVRPILNDFHTALNDVGAIFVAAEIHAGWDTEAVKSNAGRINLAGAAGGVLGNHAFVIVGYDEDGFLVLNSWGPEWGGYRPDTASGRGWAGIGHWSYQDWAERLIDGWVLRLGVPTRNAFDYSLGEQGLGAFMAGGIRSGSTPRYELVGHYVHLDDGAFVRTGHLPSDRASVEATVALLNDRRRSARTRKAGGVEKRVYDKVLLWIAGGNERTRDAVTDAVVAKPFWVSQSIYPITVLWCSDFIEQTMVVLDRLFEAAQEKVGKPGADLDRRIEIETRGIGRAFWRDIKRSARRAASAGRRSPPGGMHETFAALMELDPAIELHVVAEGAGAVLLAECFEASARDDGGPQAIAALMSRIATLTLLAPACTAKTLEEWLLPWSKMTGRRILLLTLSPATSRRMITGLYGAPILELVQRSFEEEEPGDAELLPRKEARIVGTTAAAAQAKKEYRSLSVEWLEAKGEGPVKRLRTVTFGTEARGRIAAQINNGAARIARRNGGRRDAGRK